MSEVSYARNKVDFHAWRELLLYMWAWVRHPDSGIIWFKFTLLSFHMNTICRIFTSREIYEAAQKVEMNEFDFFLLLLKAGYIDESRRLLPEKEKEFREKYGHYFDWM